MVGSLTAGYPEEAKVACERPLGVMEQLKYKKQRLTEELAEVDATIKMFEEQPGVEQCLTQLSKLGIYR